jgi:ubiquinol-cytochrome c reductase cytochrome c1 subunit
MTKGIAVRMACFFALAFAGVVQASSGGASLPQSGANLRDRASLQNGARYFVNYCVSCHSASLIRYSRIAEDLGLSESEVQGSLNFTGAKFGEPMTVAMTAADGEAFFGKAPPDLSLTARAKLGGPDWIYAYLKGFYLDESRPGGWNNTVLVGASMPNVLWELQGLQRPVYGKAVGGVPAAVEHLELAQPGSMSPEEFDTVARDIANFMQYVAEPAALKRNAIGAWVVLFLAGFTFLAWLLKSEYWRDVH